MQRDSDRPRTPNENQRQRPHFHPSRSSNSSQSLETNTQSRHSQEVQQNPITQEIRQERQISTQDDLMQNYALPQEFHSSSEQRHHQEQHELLERPSTPIPESQATEHRGHFRQHLDSFQQNNIAISESDMEDQPPQRQMDNGESSSHQQERTLTRPILRRMNGGYFQSVSYNEVVITQERPEPSEELGPPSYQEALRQPVYQETSEQGNAPAQAEQHINLPSYEQANEPNQQENTQTINPQQTSIQEQTQRQAPAQRNIAERHISYVQSLRQEHQRNLGQQEHTQVIDLQQLRPQESTGTSQEQPSSSSNRRLSSILSLNIRSRSNTQPTDTQPTQSSAPNRFTGPLRRILRRNTEG